MLSLLAGLPTTFSRQYIAHSVIIAQIYHFLCIFSSGYVLAREYLQLEDGGVVALDRLEADGEVSTLLCAHISLGSVVDGRNALC
jgi:hypothetical protein